MRSGSVAIDETSREPACCLELADLAPADSGRPADYGTVACQSAGVSESAGEHPNGTIRKSARPAVAQARRPNQAIPTAAVINETPPAVTSCAELK